MGAQAFEVIAKGQTARIAFMAAVEAAAYEYGHGGYSGSLAEKSAFVTIDVPKGTDPVTYARKLIDDGDDRVDDKWGPAGCIELAPGEFLFFGWASS
jgi:hypothetical protein